MGSLARTLLMWLVIFTCTAAFFYGLDHAVMEAQGLALNLDLSPAG